jgi:endonuclease/exonuclease/phosphatase family metal-dependent hydrolase
VNVSVSIVGLLSGRRFTRRLARAACPRLKAVGLIQSSRIEVNGDRRVHMRIASWNVNSIKARLEHAKNWLAENSPDVLLLQELKGTEFPSETFRGLGYESIAVTQKAYNGVAVLSRLPVKAVSKSLAGVEGDTHARFLEVIVKNLRIVNVYRS